MLRVLGQSEYGIYNLSSSIISYLSLLSLGIGASYVRYYFIKKKNNPDSIKFLNGLYLFIFLILGVVGFICGLIISFNVSIFFNETYSVKDISTAKILMIFLSANLALSFPMSLFISYVSSQEKFIFQKLLNMGKTVLSPALSIIALFLGYGSIGLVFVTTIINIIIDAINIYYCFKKLNMKISFRHLDLKLAKEIFIFSIFIAINQIIDQINWQTDKVILGKLISGTAVSIYAIGSTLNLYFTQFSTAISAVFAPTVNRIVQNNSPDVDEKLTNLMASVGRVQFVVLGLILSGFIFFGKYFVTIWAGENYWESYYVALLLMCPAIVPLIQNIGIEIQRAKNKHKFRSIVYLIMAILNVGISVVLCKYYGIIGVSIGTTISLVVANGFIMNIYYWKAMKINIWRFWLEIFKILPSMLIPIAIGVFFTVNGFNSIGTMFRGIAVYTSIYCLFVCLFGLNKKEKELLKKFFKMR